MPVYERYSGRYVAERVKTVDGSDEDTRLARLAADGTDGWRATEDAKARKPRAKSKPAED